MKLFNYYVLFTLLFMLLSITNNFFFQYVFSNTPYFLKMRGLPHSHTQQVLLLSCMFYL